MRVHATISTLMRQWSLRFWARNVLAIVLVGLVITPWLNEHWPLILLIAVLAGISFTKHKPHRDRLIKLLNVQFPKLEYSAQLLEAAETTGLAALQQKKVEKQLDEVVQSFKYPVSWSVVLKLLIAAGVSFLLAQVPTSSPEEFSEQLTEVGTEQLTRADKQDPIRIELESLQPKIQPPSYTGINAFISDEDIRMPEGSSVTWSFKFSGVPEYSFLHFSNGDSLSILAERQLKLIKRTDLDQGFYWLSYYDGATEERTPYYKIELVQDAPPIVEISGISQYQELPFSTDASLTFQASALDDYGLSDASIVATVTKGDGESVKFREERLTFNSPVAGKRFTETMTLMASDFDMEPGNELYFYLEASDNKTPELQSNRTETYFFVLEDTTNVEFSLAGSLGVDLMPEYFRSQRQIIIDTEKLLAEKDEISISVFKSRSNELGFDQKTLRLKYGQFLGEEDDSGIAIENEIEEDDHDHEGGQKPGEDVLAEFGHDHDHEDEEGQLMDKGTELSEAEKLVEEISHNHDDAETATFYEVSLKTKLRTALSEMWDAELYLRLFEPEKSLPYQYAALKLLKEIKNHARIYVQRIGFDPPPITEDGKRLTGDLEEIDAQNFNSTPVDSISFPAIRVAILHFGAVDVAMDSVSNTFQEILRLAGNELAAEAIRYPSKYLEELGVISRLMKMETFDKEALEEIAKLKRVFLTLLEHEETFPLPKRTSSHPLTERVREKLSIQSSRP